MLSRGPLLRSQLHWHLKVRRNGHVLLHGLLIGRVEKRTTHDGPAWFWSNDHFEDTCEGGLPTRNDALEALLRALQQTAAIERRREAEARAAEAP